MDTMNTGDPENNKLSHLDEYKALHDEITMCLHEMHRTWLWASIAAGAVYTWLPSHRSDINNIHLSLLGWSIPQFLLSLLVWLIPPVLLSFCAFRYVVFTKHITWLTEYLCKLEEEAFREKTKLPGIAHYLLERLDQKTILRKTLSWREIFNYGPVILWSALIVCSILLSWSLSQTKSDNAISGQVTASLTGLPIVGATVAVTDSSKITLTFTTDAAGHYGVSNLPTGPATVTAKKTGYTRAHSSPTIVPGTNTQNEVLVPKKSPQPKATVPTK